MKDTHTKSILKRRTHFEERVNRQGGEEYRDHDYQDQVESQALYDILEQQIVPMFYNRDGSGLPREWIARMKSSIKVVCPTFNTNRMVQEYLERAYLPAMEQWQKLTKEELKGVKELVEWETRMRHDWNGIKLEEMKVDLPPDGQLEVGMNFSASVKVFLGSIPEKEVSVDFYFGMLDFQGALESPDTVSLTGKAAGEDRKRVRRSKPVSAVVIRS